MSMSPTRIAVIIVALLAGVGAFFLTLNNRPTATVAAPVIEARTVKVLTVDKDLQRGERLTADVLKFVDWPEKALSEAYLTEAKAGELKDYENAVARSSFVQGEPLLEAKIVKAGSSGLLAAVLSPGMRAVTMKITPETAVSGFVLPGDRVDIFYSEPGDNNFTRTELMFENVKVLAINTVYTENPEAPALEGQAATVELSPADAEAFITARNSRGTLSFALRSVFTPEGPVDQGRKQKVRVIRYGRS